MAELSELGRRLIERPPVPVTPTAELRRRWRRRTIRRSGTAAAVVVAAIAVTIATVVTQGHATTRVQVVSPPSSVSPAPAKTGPTNPTPASSALDLSWTDAQDGWVLSSHPCAQGLCLGLEHTSDGGAHWRSLPDPPAEVQNTSISCFTATGDCVSDVVFATPTVGYLYGPALFVTTDGGLTWHRQTGPMVQTMAIDGNQALRVAYTTSGCPGPCQFTVQAAPIGSGTWHTLTNPTSPWGINSHILSSGSNIILAIYGNLAQGAQPAIIYRSADSGKNWAKLSDPCAAAAHLYVLTRLAATTNGTLDGLCNTPTPNTTLFITSPDDGSHWDTPQPIPGTAPYDLIGAASPTTIAVATPGVGGSGPFTAELLVSTDSGRRWTTAASTHYELRPNTLLPTWLGFETPQVGRWVSGPNTIWTTSNSGHTWTRSILP